MKRRLMALAAAIVLTAAAGATAEAEVNINVGIGIPPVVVAAPPAVVVIPGTYIYIAPDVREDLFFYRGHWWRPHGKKWYRAKDVNGPWIFISVGNVPRGLRHLPPGYRESHPGLERIEHVHVSKHWRQWEKEKHWDRHDSWKKHKREHKEHRKEHKEHGKHGRG